MMAPMIKQTAAISTMLLLLTSLPPTPCPSGVIAISAPSWKSPIPMIRRKAPVRNNTSVLISSGTSVTLKTRTIIVIGSTLERDSFVFSFSFSFICYQYPPFRADSCQINSIHYPTEKSVEKK